MNPPVQHPDPVLVPDRPWESNGIGAYNTALLEDGRFRLWYDAGVKGGLASPKAPAAWVMPSPQTALAGTSPPWASFPSRVPPPIISSLPSWSGRACRAPP